jgi:hypothetical protein
MKSILAALVSLTIAMPAVAPPSIIGSTAKVSCQRNIDDGRMLIDTSTMPKGFIWGRMDVDILNDRHWPR